MNSSAQNLLLDRVGPAAIGLNAGRDRARDRRDDGSARYRAGSSSTTRNGELLTLAVKFARRPNGHVITFEDITRQLLDQRQAAWSDVARRIAHEIKNPLTPIQLATERLNRRYRTQIVNDARAVRGTDQHDHPPGWATSGRWSTNSPPSRACPSRCSARKMPLDLVRQALFLQEVAHPAIAFCVRSGRGHRSRSPATGTSSARR